MDFVQYFIPAHWANYIHLCACVILCVKPGISLIYHSHYTGTAERKRWIYTDDGAAVGERGEDTTIRNVRRPGMTEPKIPQSFCSDGGLRR